MSGSINQVRRRFLTTAAMTLADVQFGIVSRTIVRTYSFRELPLAWTQHSREPLGIDGHERRSWER